MAARPTPTKQYQVSYYKTFTSNEVIRKQVSGHTTRIVGVECEIPMFEIINSKRQTVFLMPLSRIAMCEEINSLKKGNVKCLTK